MGPFSFEHPVPERFQRLPQVRLCGVTVPSAVTPLSRLRGLAFLDLDQAGPGLLIPRCSAVHTFGMRFPLHLIFCDRSLRPLYDCRRVEPRNFRSHREAWAVLEVPCVGGRELRRGN